MKVSNAGKAGKWIAAFIAILMFVILPAIMIFSGSGISVVERVYLIMALIFLPIAIVYFKSDAGSFVINEEGIARKLLGKNIFIAWNEMEYIGVGEMQGGPYYWFILYFSKTIPKEIYFGENSLVRQNEQHFFISYRNGMLEEVLKYVNEEKIKDIERIKECPYPHELQPYSESMRKQGKRGIWD